MTDTKRCHECDEVRPITEFRRNPHAASGRVGLCEDCHNYQGNRGRRGYIDDDVSMATPRATLAELKQTHRLTPYELQTAEEAAEALRRYREWFVSDRAYRAEYEGETADDVVMRRIPGATARERHRVLDVALGIALKDGLDLSSRPSVSEAA